MSKNLKDLIEKAEEEEKTQAQLEKTVENLELKVAKLETKLKENQSSSKLEFVRANAEIIESEENIILKNLINSQNQELSQRNHEKEALHQKIKDLNDELVNLKESFNDSIKDQVIIKTQNSLNNLIEDYGRLENINNSLKDRLSEIELEKELLIESGQMSKPDDSHIEQIEYEMSRLKKQLSDLEEANKLLENSNLNLKSRELSVDNLEIAIQNLENINNELKKENQKLLTKLEVVEADRVRMTKFEEKASNLEKEIESLKKENVELRQKDAILLAKTINVMETHRKEPTKIAEKFVSKETLLEERAGVKIEELIEVADIIEELPEPEADLNTISNSIGLNEVSKPVEVRLENEMLKEEAVTRKKVCPNCGNTNKAQIREFDDKTKIIYTHPRIYGKMYRCGQCGTEWR
ncbi:MAG: hypothetical protein KGD61_06595 [Candidatus Lokiarchaeota archaeon]|nr:hypothetical protein [Candidatus Lokiarchaeota archaeon]